MSRQTDVSDYVACRLDPDAAAVINSHARTDFGLARDIARAIAVHERICHRFETEHGPARSEATGSQRS